MHELTKTRGERTSPSLPKSAVNAFHFGTFVKVFCVWTIPNKDILTFSQQFIYSIKLKQMQVMQTLMWPSVICQVTVRMVMSFRYYWLQIWMRMSSPILLATELNEGECFPMLPVENWNECELYSATGCTACINGGVLNCSDPMFFFFVFF